MEILLVRFFFFCISFLKFHYVGGETSSLTFKDSEALLMSGRQPRSLPSNCGKPQIRSPKIIGGKPVVYGSFPWQVGLQLFNQEKQKWTHHCGGAVVAEFFIITAAHCLIKRNKREFRIVLGDYYTSRNDGYEQIFKINDIKIHPNFRQEGPYSNDIAVIEVSRKYGGRVIQFNGYVSPICLPEEHDYYTAGMSCSVTGWGTTKKDNQNALSEVLKVASVPLLDQSECKRNDVMGSYKPQQILDGMVCAGHMNGGEDACFGDSGGPLSCKIKGRHVLMGVVSWGDKCAEKNKPGIYARIKYYMPWLKKILT